MKKVECCIARRTFGAGAECVYQPYLGPAYERHSPLLAESHTRITQLHVMPHHVWSALSNKHEIYLPLWQSRPPA